MLRVALLLREGGQSSGEGIIVESRHGRGLAARKSVSLTRRKALEVSMSRRRGAYRGTIGG